MVPGHTFPEIPRGAQKAVRDFDGGFTRCCPANGGRVCPEWGARRRRLGRRKVVTTERMASGDMAWHHGLVKLTSVSGGSHQFYPGLRCGTAPCCWPAADALGVPKGNARIFRRRSRRFTWRQIQTSRYARCSCCRGKFGRVWRRVVQLKATDRRRGVLQSAK